MWYLKFYKDLSLVIVSVSKGDHEYYLNKEQQGMGKTSQKTVLGAHVPRLVHHPSKSTCQVFFRHPSAFRNIHIFAEELRNATEGALHMQKPPNWEMFQKT